MPIFLWVNAKILFVMGFEPSTVDWWYCHYILSHSLSCNHLVSPWNCDKLMFVDELGCFGTGPLFNYASILVILVLQSSLQWCQNCLRICWRFCGKPRCTSSLGVVKIRLYLCCDKGLIRLRSSKFSVSLRVIGEQQQAAFQLDWFFIHIFCRHRNRSEQQM